MNERDPRIFERAYYRRLFQIERDHWWSKAMRRDMEALLQGELRGDRRAAVLDVGCGTGYLLDYLARRMPRSRRVGIDVSLAGLRYCPAGVARWLAASADRLPFRAASFDLILCIDTLQHLSPAGADERTLAELSRLLVPGGVLYLRTNSSLGHRRLRGVDPDLYRRYDRRRLASMVGAAGLTVERASYLNCLPSLWAALWESLDRSSHPDPVSGPALSIRPPSRWRRWASPLLGAVQAAEAMWLGRLGLDLAFGHSLAIVARRPGEMPRVRK